MKKLKLLLLLGALLNVCLTAQTTVTIGSTSVFDNSVVMNGYYNYSKYQYIYESSEIGQGGTITKVGYYVGDYYLGEDQGTIENISIRLGHTSVDHFSSSAYSGDASSLVFSGDLTFSLGWNWVVLDQSFSYNGSDNLIIEFKSEDGDWFDNPIPEFAYETLPFGEVNYKRVGGRSDYDNPPSPLRGKNRASVQLNFSTTFTPIAASGSITHESCTNPNNASISLNVSGGTPPYTYAWSDNQTTATATGLSAGSISVIISDASEVQQSVVKTFEVSKIISWDYEKGMDVSVPNTITKTAADGTSNAWVRSKNELVGDGELRFTINNLTDYYIIGLSTQQHQQGSYYAIDYGWEQYGGYMYFDDYYSYLVPQVGDEFSITRVGTDIKIFHNDVQVGTTKYLALGSPLYIEASIANQGDAIEDVYIDFCQPLRIEIQTAPSSDLTATGQIDITPSGGTPAYSYQIDNSSAQANNSGIAPGSYLVKLGDSNNDFVETTALVDYKIMFDQVENLQSNSNTLSRTAGTNSGAGSFNKLRGNGYIKFKANDINDDWIIGLSSTYGGSGDPDGDYFGYYDIDYAIELYGGMLWVAEGSNFVGYVDFDVEDEISIEKTGSTIDYLLNGQSFYTSTIAATGDFVVEASIDNVGGSIGNLSSSFGRPVSVTAFATPDTIVVTDTTLLTASTQVNAQVVWTPATDLLGSANELEVSATPYFSRWYHVTASRDSFTASDSVYILVNTLPLSVDGSITDATDTTLGSIQAFGLGGIPPYHFSWDSTAVDTSFIDSLVVGLYTVTVTDSLDSIAVKTFEIGNQLSWDAEKLALSALTPQPNKNKITKENGSDDWCDGNVSSENGFSGPADGWVTFRIDDISKEYYIGFSTIGELSGSENTFHKIIVKDGKVYAIEKDLDGLIHSYELSDVALGDVYKIQVLKGVNIKYYKNKVEQLATKVYDPYSTHYIEVDVFHDNTTIKDIRTSFAKK